MNQPGWKCRELQTTNEAIEFTLCSEMVSEAFGVIV